MQSFVEMGDGEDGGKVGSVGYGGQIRYNNFAGGL
jgi:hypothetical protein